MSDELERTMEGPHYLTFPYPFNFADSDLVIDRTVMVRKLMMEMLSQGQILVCPIFVHHILSTFDESNPKWNAVKSIFQKQMEPCESVLVFMLPGWEESANVKDDIEHAKATRKTLVYVNADAYLEWLTARNAPLRERSDVLEGRPLPLRALETDHEETREDGQFRDVESVDG